MAATIYTATGCTRCKILANFLREQGIAFSDHDSLGEGREAFKAFYRQNRRQVYRDADGVAFPIYTDGALIRQGLPLIVAYLTAGTDLDGFFGHSTLHGSWIDGIFVSGGDPAQGDRFLAVLKVLKKHRFMLQIETSGANAQLLKQVLEQDLADRVIMEVKGPLDLVHLLFPQPVDSAQIRESISLAAQFDRHQFYTTVSPVVRSKGVPAEISYITPEELGRTARLIQEATGDNRQPYQLRLFDPEATDDGRFRACERLTPNALLKYRTRAQRHQVNTQILKD